MVDDSGLMRLIISDIVNHAEGMRVIATAENGKDAVAVVIKHQPDVVLMDLNMGEYDGIYATKNILKTFQVPIIILSSIGNTNFNEVLKALNHGAFDYLNKPKDRKSKIRDIDQQIVRKIRIASRSNKKNLQLPQKKKNTYRHTFDTKLKYDIIVIGASTGGPGAIENIISKLPENLPIPVIIAQHMTANFIEPFANRLDSLTPLKVKVAKLTEALSSGTIYILGGESNMVLKRSKDKVIFGITTEQFKEFNCPSINAMMFSVNEVYKERVIGIILTGMGRDGASGLASIHQSGGITIAQNEASSVVYGMPKEAVSKGGAKRVLDINEISGFVVSCLS